MYYKYIGADQYSGEIRTSFLSDGLFRFTQPTYLNDPREACPKSFINEYSPKDYAIALAKAKESNFFSETPSTQELKGFMLDPFPRRRMGDAFPHLLHQHGFKSMRDYDEQQLNDVFSRFKNQLNKEVGVFSLSKDKKNAALWANYANNYNGIVVEFNKEIENLGFIQNPVSYNLDTVGFELSLNKGIIRFNGIKIHNQTDFSKFNISDQIIDSFLFHKDAEWGYENEYRLISRLSKADKVIDKLYLYKIPFDAIKSIFIGHNVTPEHKKNILNLVGINHSLSHLKVYDQTIDSVSGNIKYVLTS